MFRLYAKLRIIALAKSKTVFDVTIQRQHGKSIAQINAELRKENEELKEKLSRAFA